MEHGSGRPSGGPAGQDQTFAGGQAQQPAQEAPDIERILAELAGYAASKNTSTPGVPIATTTAPPPQTTLSTHHVPQHLGPRPKSHAIQPGGQSQSHAGAPPVRSGSPMVDPATIFEWPQALRCVNKLSATNPQFGPKIKEMIADQDNNVKQWWQNRNSIIANQKTRNEGIRGLNAMLKGVGGKPQAETTPEEDKAEVDRFDLKVYNASQQMARAHSTMLKGLGVPFFGVDAKHVIANELQQTVAARNPLSEARITEKELIALQRKMVQYLEDMYKD